MDERESKPRRTLRDLTMAIAESSPYDRARDALKQASGGGETKPAAVSAAVSLDDPEAVAMRARARAELADVAARVRRMERK